MFKILAVAGRELKSYLHSFSFYLLAAFFFGVTGYFFWSTLSYYSLLSFQVATNPVSRVSALNLTEGVVSPFLANVAVLLLLLIPVLSMKSFVDERKQGTIELLFSYPVSPFQVLAGKYLAMLVLAACLIFPTLVYYPLAGAVGAHFETETLVTGYLGLFLVAASFAGLGIFTSCLTDHQAVSAGIGFSILLFFWIVGWMAEWTSPALAVVFRELSLIEHFRDLTRGVLDTGDLAYFVLFIVFFLLMALSVIELRTWKR